MYFHGRSLPIFEVYWLVRKHLGMYEIETSFHGECLNDFYSLVAMQKEKEKKLTRSLRPLARFFETLQLVNKHLSRALSME